MHQSSFSFHSNSTNLQWERNKRFNRELYATNKKELLSFIIQAGAHYELEQFITYEVLSLIDQFFAKESSSNQSQFMFSLKDMKMICLGCLSIRLKLNEYRALAVSLINSISVTQRRLAVNNEIALYELIVLREFNYAIIGVTNIGLTLFYSLIRVNHYLVRNTNRCDLFNMISVFGSEVIKSIQNSIKRIVILFNSMYQKKSNRFIRVLEIVTNY